MTSPKQVYQFKPLEDKRWNAFIHLHPRASVFHSTPWLEVLYRSYGYSPIAYTSAAPGEPLQNALLFCRVESWLTGRRLVSLPFSDHCDPLVDGLEQLKELLTEPQEELRAGKWKYIELRPSVAAQPKQSGNGSRQYFLHLLDLRPSLDELYRNLHHDSIRRKIQRAEREKVTFRAGTSEEILLEFYHLHVVTRHRQKLPPHPLAWFRQIQESAGDMAVIRVAKKDNRAIAAILTLTFRQTVTYKYGCSDANFHKLGAVPLLMWQMIREAKGEGMQLIDLGRSDCDNTGLNTFKERLGAKRFPMQYLRYPAQHFGLAMNSVPLKLIRSLVNYFPDRFMIWIGDLLYPHIG